VSGSVGGAEASGPCRPRGGRGEPRDAREQLRHETDPVLLRLSERLLQRHYRLRKLLQVLAGGGGGAVEGEELKIRDGVGRREGAGTRGWSEPPGPAS
jgi:hypothetical protein